MANLIFLLQIFSYAGLTALFFYGNLTDLLLTLFGYIIVKCVGNAMTYHRLVTHRSWIAPSWFLYLGNICGTLGGQGSAISWAANHIQHHRFSDQPEDPHSPKYKGMFWVQFLSMTGTVNIRYLAPYLKDKTLVWFHTYYWYIHAIYIILILFVYPFGVISLYLAPIALNWIVSGLVNNLTHMTGYRNFDTVDDSHNMLLLGYVSFGEGWHNNHHADPKNPRYGVKWWELDLAHFLIKLIQVKQ
jgi:stearoyl-CoA desaturase (delta-9 desaturase)